MNQNALTLNELKNAIAVQPESALIFMANQQGIRPGYHVTEVKFATVRAMDCGRAADEWEEIIIQLLDGPKSPADHHSHMSGAKFINIIDTTLASLKPAGDAHLYFEFAPDNAPI